MTPQEKQQLISKILGSIRSETSYSALKNLLQNIQSMAEGKTQKTGDYANLEESDLRGMIGVGNEELKQLDYDNIKKNPIYNKFGGDFNRYTDSTFGDVAYAQQYKNQMDDPNVEQFFRLGGQVDPFTKMDPAFTDMTGIPMKKPGDGQINKNNQETFNKIIEGNKPLENNTTPNKPADNTTTTPPTDTTKPPDVVYNGGQAKQSPFVTLNDKLAMFKIIPDAVKSTPLTSISEEDRKRIAAMMGGK